MDPAFFMDPNLVIRLCAELQKRIGTLPVVEAHAFHLEAQPGEIMRLLRVKPRSFSEISRAVRAARTMKLNVRGCGQRTGGDSAIYGSTPTLLVESELLADSPRLEFVEVKRKGDSNVVPGLRILACVGITELVAFQISHQIEICQSIESHTIWGTVVGAICATTPGVVGPNGGAQGGCFSDEVIAIRIVDCHGDLIEYSSDADLSAALSTLGVLGIVYDVTLRYQPITISKVSYKFIQWQNLLHNNRPELVEAVLHSDMAELIYLPYNSCEKRVDGSVEATNWNPLDDYVMLRTTKRIASALSHGENAPLVDSEPREQIYLLDPVFGPDLDEMVTKFNDTPTYLHQAFTYMKFKYYNKPVTMQFTPWAINALGTVPEPARVLRFSLRINQALSDFGCAMDNVLNLLRDLAQGGPRRDSNYAINLGLRVHFTAGTWTGRLLGVGFEDRREDINRHLLAHISFTGIMLPGPNSYWVRAANRTTTMMLQRIPLCVPQWTTEWHGIELLKTIFRKMLGNQLEPLRKLIEIADRDGVFMSELMQSIIYPKLTYYQELYKTQCEEALPIY